MRSLYIDNLTEQGRPVDTTIRLLSQGVADAERLYRRLADFYEQMEAREKEDVMLRAFVEVSHGLKKRRADKRSQAPFVRRGAGQKRNFV